MGDARESWARYVRSRDFAWHHVYARGNVAYAPLAYPENEAVAAFLRKLGQQKEVAFLAALHFLSDGRVFEFFERELDVLLRSASRATAPLNEISRGRVRGRILWHRTIADRTTGKLDQASFVTTRRLSSWNTPENQLLALFLRTVADLLGRLERDADVRGIWPKWDIIKTKAESALKHIWLREIDVPGRANSRMIANARRAREPRYGVMAELQMELDSSLLESRWEAILTLISRGWLEPVTSDDLFEVYTLVRILECLRADFGEPVSTSLIRAGRREIATFRTHDGVAVRVFFDQSPVTAVWSSSEYQTILEQYSGFRPTPRRPDILVSAVAEGLPARCLLIECKKSEDDDYTRDSVYKALAYLRDFRSLWEEVGAFYPKIMVVFPTDVQPKNDGIRAQSDLWLVGSDDDRSFKAAVRGITRRP